MFTFEDLSRLDPGGRPDPAAPVEKEQLRWR